MADEVVAIYAAAGVVMPPEGALEVARMAIEHDAVDVLRAKANTCAGQAATDAQTAPDKYLVTSFRNALRGVSRSRWTGRGSAPPGPASEPTGSEDYLEHLSEAEGAMRDFGAARVGGEG